MPLKNMSVTRHIVHTRNLFNFQDMTPLFSAKGGTVKFHTG